MDLILKSLNERNVNKNRPAKTPEMSGEILNFRALEHVAQTPDSVRKFPENLNPALFLKI